MKNTSVIGNIGLAYTIAKFADVDIPVYAPIGEGYTSDLIAEFNGKLNKILVKTTEKVHDGEYMSWKITHQKGYHGNRVKYTSSEVDYFALYCIQSKTLCLVPYEQAQTNDIIIRLDSYAGTRLKTMKFVSDFSFETIISK